MGSKRKRSLTAWGWLLSVLGFPFVCGIFYFFRVSDKSDIAVSELPVFAPVEVKLQKPAPLNSREIVAAETVVAEQALKAPLNQTVAEQILKAPPNQTAAEHFLKGSPKQAVWEPPIAPVFAEIQALEQKVAELRLAVTRLKKTFRPPRFMETDPEAIQATTALQDATRKLLHLRYGKGPYRVALNLEFPASIPGPRQGLLIVELAPENLLPHSVHTFMQFAIDETWQGGEFHRVAPHVIQARVKTLSPGLAFQEYSKEYPHVQRTLGFAGRPGGPAFYISTINNTRNHGPGSQKDKNPHEAVSCFGKIVVGGDDVVKRMEKPPPAAIRDRNGYFKGIAYNVRIESVNIVRNQAV